jgi:hypothetical protein
MKGIYNLWHLGLDNLIILKFILKIYGVMMYIGFSLPRIGEREAGFCEYINEHSGFIKGT